MTDRGEIIFWCNKCKVEAVSNHSNWSEDCPKCGAEWLHG